MGHNNNSTATTLFNIGVMFDSKGNYNEAEKYLLQSLEIKIKVCGNEHSDVGLVYNWLGSV